MSIFDRLNRPQQLFAASELPTPNTVNVDAASEVLAAAERVSKRFGAQTNKDVLAAALTASKTQADFAAAFKAANIGIIDIADVLRYRSARTRPTFLERIFEWSRIVKEFLASALIDSGLGNIFSIFVIVPIGIPFLIDTFWYDVSYFRSYLLSLFILVLLDPKKDDGLAWAAGLTLGPLAWAIATPIGVLFYRAGSVRKWTSMSVEDYPKTLPNSVVLSIDQVLEALPTAKIELDILQPAQGEKDEMFVTMPLGGTDDRLYLWHEPASD